ncbi:MAG: hypothetical protein L0338_06375, partial [Acidobacteria bacterium]|nr:hypothetical protein [Acidobacteriota bacterium]
MVATTSALVAFVVDRCTGEGKLTTNAMRIDVNLGRFRPRLTQKARQSWLPRRLTRAWVATIGVLFVNR